MARRLRVSFASALYHVINRGNYRRDVFATDGAARAFLTTIDETCRRLGWRVCAYVVMSTHYHLAVQTPQANLSEGMHWLHRPTRVTSSGMTPFGLAPSKNPVWSESESGIFSSSRYRATD